jgi:NAD(P)-dependent dehydrogenase (short-subunit alcohol dehydrogenase family)
MQVDFDGKTIVVTGGANGIGNACARLFASSGGDVWILDNEDPSAAASDIGAHGLMADVSDAAQVERALDRVMEETGKVDVVAINAGIARFAALLSTSDEVWNDTLSVNLTGAFNTLRAAARRMITRRQGAIVLTASTNSYDGESDLVAYNATKAGVLGLLHTAANELGPYGIRVNAVCPGLIRTRITADHFGNASVIKEYFRDIPLGRGGEPYEVASAVVFLASGHASFITGATLFVDGGQMATKFGTWKEDMGVFDGSQWKLR